MEHVQQEFLGVLEAVEEAGERILQIYKESPIAKAKEDDSPVTEADLEAQYVILKTLRSFDYGILSEEQHDDGSRLQKERVWILDPLDGTSDFLQKTGEFSIMLGLVEKGIPIFGIVHQPTSKKTYIAKKGKGAFIKEGNVVQKISVSSITDFSKARFIASRNHFAKEEQDFLENCGVAQIVHMGSAGLKIGLIAEGKAEGYISMTNKTKEWDLCAGDIILSEAGGIVSGMNGESYVYNKEDVNNTQGIIAGNPAIHEKIIKQLQRV